MKKILALVLVMLMLVAFAFGCAKKSEGPVEPIDWAPYDQLITDIKMSTDFVSREALLHDAEDMLMDTGTICPIYYYNDVFMMRDGVEGFYSTVYGTKYFMFTTFNGADTLRINLASEPDKLDPALNSSVDGACLAANSFGGLYTYNEAGETVPEFATGYTVSDDGLTYVFDIRDGLTWSNGDPLTAKDFEYSWKRAANPETAADYSYMLSGIAGFGTDEGINVSASADGKQFTVVMAAPCAYMLDLCAFPTFYPVHQASVEAAAGYLNEDGTILNAGAWATEAGFVSSGAYTLESWNHDESMVYVKNPNYWNAENVTMERLEFMLSADDTAIYAAYRAGDVDFIDTVPNDEIQTLLADNDPEFYIIDNLGTYYVCFNVKSQLYAGMSAADAITLRKALSLMIDRDYIVETVGQTGQEIATSFIPSAMLDGHGGEFKLNDDSYTYPDATDEGYFSKDVATNVAKARELLESIGYEFGSDGMLKKKYRFTFEYLTNESTGHIAIAECIQADLAAIGITMTIKSVDWDVFLNERKEGNYDIARNGWLADFNDPINMLEMWTSDSGNNDVQLGK